MLNSIVFYPILGVPIIIYGGIIVFLLMIITAILGYLIHSGKSISLKSHLWLARITIILALIHGLLGILTIF